MKKILAVYDSDAFYAIRFMEYFKNRKAFDFEISAFTIKEGLEAFLQSHIIEILILGRPVNSEEIPMKNIKHIYYLSEDRNQEQDKEQPSIFKYQPVQAVMAEVLADYARKMDAVRVNFNSKRMNILTVFPIRAGAEKLTFAWSMGFQLAKQNKVLFVPLELLPTHSLSFADNSKQALSEFIYYLKENQDITGKMKSLLGCSGSLFYLSGTAHGFDLLSLNKEDIRKWVEAIRLHTDYQSVIFYLDYYNDSAVELMSLSDAVIIPTDRSIYEKVMLREWKEQMDRIGMNTEFGKYQSIILRQEQEEKELYGSLQELFASPAWSEAARYFNNSIISMGKTADFKIKAAGDI